jgi:hypothetical protein
VDNLERAAAFIGVIRHELAVSRGADALDALEASLRPADPAQRPPTRAPAIIRLRRALRALRRNEIPDSSLDEFASDLRFLRLFDDASPVLDRPALAALLRDVEAESSAPPADKPLRAVPTRRPRVRRR